MTPTVNSASVIDLRAYADPSVVPTLVLVDLQKEYIAAPRILALPHAPQALANCRIALTHARTKGFPVAFVRWLGRSALFNRATPFSGWIEGFEPTGADMVFERDRPSCYSSLSFGEVMGDSGSSFVLAGFAGESACLATAIDAFHRGHRITYLDDASASHTLDEIAAPDVHRVVSKVLGLYADSQHSSGLRQHRGREHRRELKCCLVENSLTESSPRWGNTSVWSAPITWRRPPSCSIWRGWICK